MGLVIVTPPSSPLLTTAEAKLHERVDQSAEDALVDAYVGAATEAAEAFLRRPILTTAYRYTFDEFPVLLDESVMRLPIGGVRAISKIGYVDVDGNDVELDSTLWLSDLSSQPARIAPAYHERWPRTRAQLGACFVEFTAGYGDDVASVPKSIVQAVRLIFGHNFMNREDSAIGVSVAEIPKGAEYLLWPHRVFGIRAG